MYKTIIRLLIAAFFFTGCFKERIELDLNQGDNVRFAIEAWITDLDELQTITLSQSSDYFESFEPSTVTNAIVTLSYDNQSVTMSHTANGVYAAPTDWRATAGKEYTLTINHDGEEYTANSFMREMSNLDNPFPYPSEIESDTTFFDIYFSFQEIAGEGDGYFFIDYKKEELDWNLNSGEFTSDEFIDGNYFTDISITNESYLLGDTVILEAYSIGTEASKFLEDIQSETFREGLFDPPPVNIRSNFSNNALGYFIASGADRVELVVE